jgi:hypothetical protein
MKPPILFITPPLTLLQRYSQDLKNWLIVCHLISTGEGLIATSRGSSAVITIMNVSDLKRYVTEFL